MLPIAYIVVLYTLPGRADLLAGALGYIIFLLLVFFVPGITTTWNLEYTGTTKRNTSKYLYIVISTK